MESQVEKTAEVWKNVFSTSIIGMAMTIDPKNYNTFKDLLPVTPVPYGYDMFRVVDN